MSRPHVPNKAAVCYEKSYSTFKAKVWWIKQLAYTENFYKKGMKTQLKFRVMTSNQ